MLARFALEEVLLATARGYWFALSFGQVRQVNQVQYWSATALDKKAPQFKGHRGNAHFLFSHR